MWPRRWCPSKVTIKSKRPPWKSPRGPSFYSLLGLVKFWNRLLLGDLGAEEGAGASTSFFASWGSGEAFSGISVFSAFVWAFGTVSIGDWLFRVWVRPDEIVTSIEPSLAMVPISMVDPSEMVT